MTSRISRGEIWLADLKPRYGAEPAKTRPVLVIQSQALLDAGYSTTLVIPVTTKLIDDAEPLRIRIAAAGRLKRESDLLIAQLRAIDHRRFTAGPLLRVPASLLARVEGAIREVTGITAG